MTNDPAGLPAPAGSPPPSLPLSASEGMFEFPAVNVTYTPYLTHNPLPHWAVERVLLSPDLVPHILGPLEAEDGAAAAVCTQWLVGWKATNEPRRRLKQVPLDFPEEIDTDGMHNDMIGTGTPDGRLVVATDSEVHILDRSMRVLQTVPGEYRGVIAANDDSIFHAINVSSGYVSIFEPVLRRSSHDGTVDAEYQLEDYKFFCPVLAPGGLLFCVIYMADDGDEIIALDAQTMQLRQRFGRGLLSDAEQLAVGGDELYACDTGKNRLQVFSLTGEHRRSITGEWRSPMSLCFAKDRLYLVEEGREEDEDGESVDPAFPLQGRRILVLSLQGDILQVVTHPTEPSAFFRSICCFDHKLLARYTYSIVGSADTHTRKYGMLALQGM